MGAVTIGCVFTITAYKKMDQDGAIRQHQKVVAINGFN